MPTPRALKEAAERLGINLLPAMIDPKLWAWWKSAETVSRKSPEWQAIESAADWGKSSPAELFKMAEKRDAIRSGVVPKRTTWQRVKGWFGG